MTQQNRIASTNKTLVGLTVGATGALLALGAVPAAASSENATVTVLHGVPETPVDVYADGEQLIDDFQPGTFSDSLSLPAGSYDLALYPADTEDVSGTDPLLSQTVDVPAGANATVAAHLTAEGEPALTPFVNDTSEVPAGEARATVRHVAAAGPVDVSVSDQVVIEGLENPNEESLTAPAGTVSAAVLAAGTDTTVIGPADLTLEEGTNTIVHAWGSEDAGYELAVQTIDVSAGAPTGVPGGSAGLADDEGLPAGVIGLSLAGLVAAGVAGRRLAAHRG